MILDLDSGRIEGQSAQSVRRLNDICSIFAAGDFESGERIVYEIFGSPAEVEGPARLLYATTILHPGTVAGEYFMTRGHYHTRTDRGELVLTLAGSGQLLLMNREGKTWAESMTKGSLHDIDGRYAHRVVNTGSSPLVFFVSWMSDCGHDYESIMESGFGLRYFENGAITA